MINRLIDYDLHSRRPESRVQLPHEAEDEGSGLKTKLDSLTRKYPVALIAAGLVAGVCLGYWVKRKP